MSASASAGRRSGSSWRRDSPVAAALEYAGAARALGAADTVQDAIADLRD